MCIRDSRNGEASVAERRTHKWLTGLVELQKSTRDIHDFVEQVKVDLFPNDIFVFTPKGEIIRLPANATPVDFAYAVHSRWVTRVYRHISTTNSLR